MVSTKIASKGSKSRPCLFLARTVPALHLPMIYPDFEDGAQPQNSLADHLAGALLTQPTKKSFAPRIPSKPGRVTSH